MVNDFCSPGRRPEELHAAGGLGQARVAAGLLRRTEREEFVEVAGVGLVGSETLADLALEHTHCRRDAVFEVVFAQEQNHFPVLVPEIDAVLEGHRLGDLAGPVDEILQIAALVDLVLVAVDFQQENGVDLRVQEAPVASLTILTDSG